MSEDLRIRHSAGAICWVTISRLWATMPSSFKTRLNLYTNAMNEEGGLYPRLSKSGFPLS